MRTITLITQEEASRFYKKSVVALQRLRNSDNPYLILGIHYILDGRSVLYCKEVLDHWRLNSNADGSHTEAHTNYCQRFLKDKERGEIQIKELQEVV